MKNKGTLQSKSFIFDFDAVENGTADKQVNDFCRERDVLSILFDRHQAKIIYRILYKE